MSPFEVVVEPARRELLDALVEGPKAVGELAAAAGLSQPNTSRHLRILREAGFVAREPVGQRRLYHLRPERLAELDAWLTPYRELWRSSLDALERRLDERTSPCRTPTQCCRTTTDGRCSASSACSTTRPIASGAT